MGNYAYICFYEKGLYVFDVSNPASPQEIASLILSGGFEAMQVYVSGDYAYVTDDANKFHVIDVSNPSSPVETGDLQMTSPSGAITFGNNIYVKGNYAYVTIPTPSTGLVIVNISNPESPEITGIYESASRFMEVSIAGQYAYVVDESNGLQVIDVSDPANPVQAGYYFDVSGYAESVFVDENYCYLDFVISFHQRYFPVIYFTGYHEAKKPMSSTVKKTSTKSMPRKITG